MQLYNCAEPPPLMRGGYIIERLRVTTFGLFLLAPPPACPPKPRRRRMAGVAFVFSLVLRAGFLRGSLARGAHARYSIFLTVIASAARQSQTIINNHLSLIIYFLLYRGVFSFLTTQAGGYCVLNIWILEF